MKTNRVILRQVSENRGNEEMVISVNGPEIANADKIPKKALDNYFKGHKSTFYTYHIYTSLPIALF
jgi:hypothetical protein